MIHRASLVCVTGCFLVFSGVVFSGVAVHAASKIDSVSPRGLQSGATTTLTFTGAGFRESTRLLINLPGGAQVTQAAKPGATANQIQLDVTLPAEVPAGVFTLRLADEGGISDAVAVGIDALPQIPFAAEINSLPVAVVGGLSGGATLETRFAGKAGQQFVADIQARRLGAALNPVLGLYDGRGVLLASSEHEPALSGDARLTVKLPADGTYTIKLHDALFRGAEPGHFRLRAGELSFADLAFPLAVTRGQASAIEFPGSNLPADARAVLTATEPGRYAFAAWPDGTLPCTARPTLGVSDAPEAVETPQEGKLQELAAPGGVSGRISKAGEKDQYLVHVKPGAKLRFETIAARAGSPLDGMLTVTRQDGGALGASDDQQETVDPGLEVAIPAEVAAVIVTVQDRLAGGGPKHIYHLGISDVSPGDFSLVPLADRIAVPQGGQALVRVRANRAGYNGPIKLSFPGGLPDGVTVASDVIPAGATDGLVTLSAASGAAPTARISALMGETEIEPAEARLRRPAMLPATPGTQVRPALREELAVAVVQPAALTVAFAENAPKDSFNVNSKVELPVSIARAGGATGAVRLTLITSQIPPTIQEGAEAGKPDIAKTLRLDPEGMIPADQSAGTLNLVVPDGLPEIEYDLAIQADLLGPDGQQVLGTAVTPARRFKAVKP